MIPQIIWQNALIVFAFLGLNKDSWFSFIAALCLIQSPQLKYIYNYPLAVGQNNQHARVQIVCRLSFSSEEEIALCALSFTSLSFLPRLMAKAHFCPTLFFNTINAK